MHELLCAVTSWPLADSFLLMHEIGNTFSGNESSGLYPLLESLKEQTRKTDRYLGIGRGGIEEGRTKIQAKCSEKTHSVDTTSFGPDPLLGVLRKPTRRTDRHLATGRGRTEEGRKDENVSKI